LRGDTENCLGKVEVDATNCLGKVAGCSKRKE
jgi:hypothetical protein